MLPFSPFISMALKFFLPGQNLEASIVPIAPFSNSTAAATASSTSTFSFFPDSSEYLSFIKVGQQRLQP